MAATRLILTVGGERLALTPQLAPHDDGALEKVVEDILCTNVEILTMATHDSETVRFVFFGQTILSRTMDGQTPEFDLLFLDNHAIPTIIEVKRATNPETKDKARGQLDRYLQALQHWTLDQWRSQGALAYGGEAGLAAALGGLGVRDIDRFLDNVRQNTLLGRARLVLAAPNLSDENHRIMWNRNLGEPASEFCLLDVNQFSYGGLTLESFQLYPMVTRLAGRDAAASRRGERWTEDRFLAALQANRPNQADIAKTLMQAAAGHGIKLEWGTGTDGQMMLKTVERTPRKAIVAVNNNGELMWRFNWFDDEAASLAQAFEQAIGWPIPPDAWDAKPHADLASLRGKETALLATLQREYRRLRDA